MANYIDQVIARGKAEHGEKFDSSALTPEFARYWYSKERIKVRVTYLDGHSDILFGTVGMTTGWKPAFLLMHNIRSTGSSMILDHHFHVIGVKQKGYKKYSKPY